MIQCAFSATESNPKLLHPSRGETYMRSAGSHLFSVFVRLRLIEEVSIDQKIHSRKIKSVRFDIRGTQPSKTKREHPPPRNYSKCSPTNIHFESPFYLFSYLFDPL